jgi:hypothetical protein
MDVSYNKIQNIKFSSNFNSEGSFSILKYAKNLKLREFSASNNLIT